MADSDRPAPAADAPSAVTPEGAYRALRRHPAWIVERNRVYRDFRLDSFAAAIELVDRVAVVAEAVDHHPNIRIHEWCFVQLEVYSHVTGGLTSRDLALVEAIDAMLDEGARAAAPDHGSAE
jgi:4a-hydroxytetrahydrobiopterin dehydratase